MKEDPRRRWAERLLARVECERAHPPSEHDLRRIRSGLRSIDEHERAQAVRAICPCRMPWDVFETLRKQALKLRDDPCELVRAQVAHIEKDAREVGQAEQMLEQVDRYEEAQNLRQRRALRRS